MEVLMSLNRMQYLIWRPDVSNHDSERRPSRTY